MIEALFSNNTYNASKALLDVTSARQAALSANIANAETPGYKRIDLPANFQAELAGKIRAGQASEIGTPSLVRDRLAVARGADGNNVQLDKELLHLGNNSLEYDTLVEFVSGSLQQLKAAITGRSL